MRPFRSILALVVCALGATSALADDYRDQLRSMDYHELIKIDSSSLNDRQRHTYQEVRRDRERRVQRTYEQTRVVSNPYTATSTIASPEGLLLTANMCTTASECTIILRRDVRNDCRKPGFRMPPEFQFCGFETAHALGGISLPVTRVSFDVVTRTSQRLVGLPRACLDCPNNQRKVTDVEYIYKETYGIGIPLMLIRSTAEKGNLSMQLSGRGGTSVVGINQEAMIGFLRRIDEAMPTLRAGVR